MDAKGKNIAKGYTYHGVAEAEQNARMFNNKALKEGHAYYISALFFNKYFGGDFAQAVISIFQNEQDQIVSYRDDEVRNEVLTRAKTFAGYIPVSVVIAGGTDYSKTPVILGLIPVILGLIIDEEKSKEEQVLESIENVFKF